MLTPFIAVSKLSAKPTPELPGKAVVIAIVRLCGERLGATGNRVKEMADKRTKVLCVRFADAMRGRLRWRSALHLLFL